MTADTVRIKPGMTVRCVFAHGRFGEIEEGETYQVQSVNDEYRVVWLVGHDDPYDTTRFRATEHK